MATTRMAVATRNKQLDQVRADFDSCYIRCYTGALESTPETTEAGTLVAELRGNATAYPAASGGIATFNSITPDSSADSANTIGHIRILKSDGTTVLAEMDAGESGSGAAAIFDETTAAVGAQVSISQLTLTLPM